MLYVGLLSGIVAGHAAARVAGLETSRAYWATLILLVAGLAGGRFFHVAQYWREYVGHRSLIWNRTSGGTAMYGGFLIMLPLSVPLLNVLDLPFAAFWDTMVFTTLVLLICVRIGCFMHGCCAGRPSCARIAHRLPNERGSWERRLPAQLFEGLWCTVLLVVAAGIWSSLPVPGALALAIAALYGAGRLLLQTTRERDPASPRFTLHHGISLALVVLSAVELHSRWP